MKLRVTHDTSYCYEQQVRESIQYLRLTPQPSLRQQVLHWQLELPRPAREQVDPFGNLLHVLTLDEPHEAILIRARGEVEIDESRESEPDPVSALPYLRSTRLTQPDAGLRDFARRHSHGRGDRHTLIDLMQALSEHMVYTPGSTRVDSTAAEAFERRVGVCQDHTHTFLACVRSLGLPARYVSGYLCTADSDHVASHAWAEVWIDTGWYSFDVSNCLARPERHLKLAVGLDYLDACPVRGVRRGGGIEHMHARVQVDSSTMPAQAQQQ